MSEDQKENLINEFDPVFDRQEKANQEMEQVSFWIPKDKKIKFDLMQEETKKEFGKRLKELVVSAIEISELKED